jgi:hypothetical protein
MRLHAVAAELQQRAQDEAGMRSTEAEMRAEAEAEMRVRFAVEADLIGMREGGFVEVGRSPASEMRSPAFTVTPFTSVSASGTRGRCA